LDEDSTAKRNRIAGLLREYAVSTKGFQPLRWSAGLKKYFQIGELTDDDIVSLVVEDAVLWAEISLDDWRIVRKNNLQATILDAAMHGGSDLVHAVIDSYKVKI
jgi:hypothetical protein